MAFDSRSCNWTRFVLTLTGVTIAIVLSIAAIVGNHGQGDVTAGLTCMTRLGASDAEEDSVALLQLPATPYGFQDVATGFPETRIAAYRAPAIPETSSYYPSGNDMRIFTAPSNAVNQAAMVGNNIAYEGMGVPPILPQSGESKAFGPRVADPGGGGGQFNTVLKLQSVLKQLGDLKDQARQFDATFDDLSRSAYGKQDTAPAHQRDSAAVARNNGLQPPETDALQENAMSLAEATVEPAKGTSQPQQSQLTDILGSQSREASLLQKHEAEASVAKDLQMQDTSLVDAARKARERVVQMEEPTTMNVKLTPQAARESSAAGSAQSNPGATSEVAVLHSQLQTALNQRDQAFQQVEESAAAFAVIKHERDQLVSELAEESAEDPDSLTEDLRGAGTAGRSRRVSRHHKLQRDGADKTCKVSAWIALFILLKMLHAW